MWAKCCRTLKHAGQETNGANESYHSHLKKVFLRSIRSASHRRVDWLVHQLITVVHIFYWWRECGKENGFHRNFRVEKIEAQSWLRAQSIPDDNVTLHQSDPSMAWVQSQHDEMKRYMVWQSGPNFAMCDCNWAKNGYLCKHVIKVTMIRDKNTLEQEELEIRIDETTSYQVI